MAFKLFLRVFKILAKIFLYLILLLLIVFAIKYITCPVYIFEQSHPFEGETFYNPYQEMDASHWRKANFQIQSYAWKGITSGRGNTNEVIHDVYKSLNYDIIATSDYQKINKYLEDQQAYIPVYEHGYGIKKNHQVLIGAKKVLWKDYPFFQTIHNMQHILNSLRPDNELTFIAHPKLRHGYSPEDMELLTNYDGIEVLNNYRTSLEHWDAALSSGKYVTILGNDDAHDISNPNEIGHHCTFVNAPAINKEEIIESLKAGNAFGAMIYRPYDESFSEKTERIKILPMLENFEIKGDSILIKTDSIAKEIKFIGQGGKLLKGIKNTNNTYYKIEDNDTYVRTEIEFPGQHIYYLNPVCRSTNYSPPAAPLPEINYYRTYILRIIGFGTIIFIFINVFYIRKRIKKKRVHS